MNLLQLVWIVTVFLTGAYIASRLNKNFKNYRFAPVRNISLKSLKNVLIHLFYGQVISFFAFAIGIGWTNDKFTPSDRPFPIIIGGFVYAAIMYIFARQK